MSDPLMIAIVSVVIELTIIGFAKLAFRHDRKFERKLTLISYKHDAWVESYQKHSGNGLLESYKSILKEKMAADNFIEEPK
jgi:hypothetical protein